MQRLSGGCIKNTNTNTYAAGRSQQLAVGRIDDLTHLKVMPESHCSQASEGANWQRVTVKVSGGQVFLRSVLQVGVHLLALENDESQSVSRFGRELGRRRRLKGPIVDAKPERVFFKRINPL